MQIDRERQSDERTHTASEMERSILWSCCATSLSAKNAADGHRSTIDFDYKRGRPATSSIERRRKTRVSL